VGWRYALASNVIFDNRYGYAYDAAGRMSDFTINGVVQAEYEYNALGQQVVRRLTQAGQTIHSIHDVDGNRIAKYLYDESLGTSSLIREYIWANGQVVGVYENGALYFVRTDHIGRPVFATDSSGAKVWEASYLPFGGVQASSGPNPGLRFPGQWFQSRDRPAPELDAGPQERAHVVTQPLVQRLEQLRECQFGLTRTEKLFAS